METTAENHNQSKGRVMVSGSNRYIYKTTPQQRHRDHCRGRTGKIVKCRGSGSLLCDCLLVMLEATPMKSYQHDCLNMS